MMPFADQVAIVTGAASGIGRSVTRSLASNGANVIAIDRNGDGLERLRSESRSIHPACCDVTHHDQLEKIVREFADRFSRVDILVNNAGLCYYERHTESSLGHWRETMAVNVESMYVLAKLVVPRMIERRYGRIVNVSSVQAQAAEPVVGAYAASKGAISAWSRALAVDLAEHGILVNVVAPGCIRTEMSIVNNVDETTTPQFQEWYVKQRKIPLGRPGTSEEVANVIAFLCSDQCTYVTGHTMVVDGGLTITF